MKSLSLALIFVCTYTLSIFSQINSDSLIRFSDLRFHSDFERKSLCNFVNNRNDTFNLFLAIDENMTTELANKLIRVYNSSIDELKQKNIQEKKINRKIKITYSTIHEKFLRKYNDNEYFPVTFQVGTYNCVSASMLYSLVFDELKIPYKVMASSNHVYLIANPGSNSIVIETTNPNFENAIFNGEFKQQYANYLRTSKLISEDEYKNKSAEEIFEQKFKEVREASFNNLAGFQYFNKALSKLQNNDIENGLKLCQKAYFFYPDQQVKTLLYTSLLYEISKCDFDKVSDIDYLSQFSRFENVDTKAVVSIFNNVIAHFLQYTDKELHCDSLYLRLISQISDKKLNEEISFSYNIQMSYRYGNSDKVEKYVIKALEIKGNYKDANIIFENYLRRKLYNISNPNALLDTINSLQQKYKFKEITPLLEYHKLIGYLKVASELYEQKKIATGDKYLLEFENLCINPINDEYLRVMIEQTYNNIANYYYNLGNTAKSKSYVARGLKYVPNSKLLKSFLD